MPRYHMIDGKQVPFTDEEETARDAEEAAEAAAQPTRAALGEIRRLESLITPRRAREHMLGTGGSFIADIEAKIETERAKL